MLGLDQYHADGEAVSLITIDRQDYTAGAIASITGGLSGDMPQDIYEILETAAANFNLRPKDRSYASGAVCLVPILSARKEKLARLNRAAGD